MSAKHPAATTATRRPDGCNHTFTAASPSLTTDLRTVAAALVRTDHTRRCEGFYRCTCIVGQADAALKRIEEAVRAAL